jgi:hypothetical protein
VKRTELKRGKPLKRSGGLRRTGQLPPMSKKRRQALPDRDACREAVLTRDSYRCRAACVVPDVACGGQLDVHEIIPRSAWPDGWLVAENCLTVCRAHHTWIGFHPTKAAELGLHAFSWDRERM